MWNHWDGTLPEFGPVAAAAKMDVFAGRQPTGARAAAWQAATATFQPAFGADFQATYFDDWLRFAGVTDIRSVYLRPNLATADAGSGCCAAQADATQAAKGF